MKDESICIALSMELKEKIKEYAKQYGMSVNALIRCAVIEYMNK